MPPRHITALLRQLQVLNIWWNAGSRLPARQRSCQRTLQTVSELLHPCAASSKRTSNSFASHRRHRHRSSSNSRHRPTERSSSQPSGRNLFHNCDDCPQIVHCFLRRAYRSTSHLILCMLNPVRCQTCCWLHCLSWADPRWLCLQGEHYSRTTNLCTALNIVLVPRSPTNVPSRGQSICPTATIFSSPTVKSYAFLLRPSLSFAGFCLLKGFQP